LLEHMCMPAACACQTCEALSDTCTYARCACDANARHMLCMRSVF
jgi:hypothetical protein